jgi:hypothetical protein
MLKRYRAVTVDDARLESPTLPAVMLAVRPVHGCPIIYGVAGAPTFREPITAPDQSGIMAVRHVVPRMLQPRKRRTGWMPRWCQ